ncbi:MAG: DUF2161 family putative PD-(D/E)XK-type phosphodiesterase [Bacillota bacterium]|nr:DUF2161 family putative PD-(D/E)XK-type phosphodiesterase [Bacillota bacterium]
MLETELYAPVKALFESMGYTVKGEIGDCDVMGIRGEEIIAIELKLHLNLDVIVQAALRQKVADKVYIAVPSPKRDALKRWQNVSHLLRRLEIGLITIKTSGANITFDAVPFNRPMSVRRSNKLKDKLITEFNGRHGDNNTGGTKGKNVTVYREQAILIATLMEKYGSLKLCDIVAMTGNTKSASILRNNYYLWFSCEKKGVYHLTEKGLLELSEYHDLASLLINEVE